MEPKALLSHLRHFSETRAHTEALCAPLLTEDYNLQAMPEVSPTKWHLAHTSWFFEQFLLVPHCKTFSGSAHPRVYAPFKAEYSYLFNSYYESVGKRVDRPRRGLLSRPTLDEIKQYRTHVTDSVREFLSDLPEEKLHSLLPILTLGIHHEQQHQELILTDIKFNFFNNPLRPAYQTKSLGSHKASSPGPDSLWIDFPEKLRSIGRPPEDSSFCFDNETPRHPVFQQEFSIQNRPVTQGEYLEFIEEDGYLKPEFWLSDGWATVQRNGWKMPLYWEKEGNNFNIFTLNGMQKLDPKEPVCHLSFYEADAYARFRGLRLPREDEWEISAEEKASSFFGEVWEWTASSYLPYPGFHPLPDALGEYNGKFMSNQMVLRGGSFATPRDHIRPTYRNFFPPDSRWQFSGMRLAQ